MEIGTIIIAAIVIFIAWKLLTGLIKFGLIAAVILGAIYFLTQGGAV
ncbi:hypothetical protein [Pseudoblastomonas halimionae]|uniref:Uncharacterized protein n=1 Tax=Alteriqipengyuania halimionae TaxID=1926630 RepID=A0A6I4U0N2_9SPHN|nr:hypothetical protein [Alteriqipengyuania halimionae]MXP09438.1 hypothetical protein [Alteriqipengyuania halimionae]